jgi:four helix bundle protein
MALFKTFEEIEAWQKTRELVKHLYTLTSAGGFTREFGLRDQMRRAAVSVMANNAESFERGSRKQFLQYLGVAKASAAEVRSHLYVAQDLGYLSEKEAELLFGRVLEVSRMIAGLMTYLRSTRLPSAPKSLTRSS